MVGGVQGGRGFGVGPSGIAVEVTESESQSGRTGRAGGGGKLFWKLGALRLLVVVGAGMGSACKVRGGEE